MFYKLSTCDNHFVGTLQECKDWFHADSFSPRKIDWDTLLRTGKLQLGFPWGEIYMKEVW